MGRGRYIGMARKFCKTCKYNLRGLTDHVCPECGQPFDPENPETFSKYGPNVLIETYQKIVPPLQILGFLLFAFLVSLFVVVVLCLIFVGSQM